MTIKSTKIIDTNILVSSPDHIFSFEDTELILPFVVVEEIDKLKSRPNEIGANARETVRTLAELINDKEPGALKAGVAFGNGNILRVVTFADVMKFEKLSDDWDMTNKDNKIIEICKSLCIQYKSEGKEPPKLITKDILLRVKCYIMEIPCELFKGFSLVEHANKIYSGVQSINVPDEIIQNFWEDYESPDGDFYFDVEKYTKYALYPNEFLILKNNNVPANSSEPVLRYIDKGKPLKIVRERYNQPICGIKPRNREQNLALDLLMDDNVKLVSLSGISGAGKSLLSIAAGLELVLGRGKYKTFLICRPTIPVGQDLGFMPGSKAEKLEPWFGAIRDNIRQLLFSSSGGKKSKNNEITLQMLIDEGTIETEAITFLRGRSINNTFMLLDESQNTSAHELKTIITRVGENTKLVATGDLSQVDSLYLDSVSNGLAVAIEKFKPYPIAGHLALSKGERSSLSSIASNILV